VTLTPTWVDPVRPSIAQVGRSGGRTLHSEESTDLGTPRFRVAVSEEVVSKRTDFGRCVAAPSGKPGRTEGPSEMEL
jgi:hypothetical protein